MALHWYGRYTREEFADLPGEKQSRIVALYMIEKQVDAIISWEQVKEMKNRG